MDLKLDGKRVLVTGSSRGIGLKIAQKFSHEGCKVVLNSRAEIPRATIDLAQAYGGVAGDVSSERGARAVVESSLDMLGELDILICNVGSGKSVPPGQENREAWTASFDTNFFSTAFVVQAAAGPLGLTNGVIICISSICGSEVVPGAPVTYSVAKAALNAYIKGISRPLGDQGIRICGISPGNIMFEGSVWDSKVKEDPSRGETVARQGSPVKKVGEFGSSR